MDSFQLRDDGGWGGEELSVCSGVRIGSLK